MLKRSLLIGSLAVALVFAALWESAHAQSGLSAGPPSTSLNEVKQAILAATGYDPNAVGLTATNAQFIVTLVNSKLVAGPAFRRESEASRITAAITGVIAEMPEFNGIQAIHIDYVSRKPDGSASRPIDGVDFRKDPQGNFQHHITWITAAFRMARTYSQSRARFTQDSGDRMRAFFVVSLMAAIIGAPICSAVTAHEGWFVRVCPAKTEAHRINLTFSGGRQGFGWSWNKGRTPNETDLPRRFRSVARVYMRGSTASTPSNIQPHAYVCVGFRDHIVQRLEFDDHEDHQKNWNDTDDCAC